MRVVLYMLTRQREREREREMGREREREMGRERERERERERVPPIKKNILNRMMYFELFREHRESKANPNFNDVTAYVKKFSTSIISDFYASLYYRKKGTASQNEDFLIPRHGNAKKPTAAAYYRTDSQTISKARTMLSENYSSSSIYNEVNHEAKLSVGEETRDPKQL